MTGASIFNKLGEIPSGPGDSDGLRLERRFDSRAGVKTIGGISFGQGEGKVDRGNRLLAQYVDAK